jgi:hypothetical protein
MLYWIGYSVTLAVGIVVGVALLLGLPRYVRNPGWMSRWQNITLLLLTTFIAYMAAEFYFRLFFAQTGGTRYTLATQIWFERYWRLNSLGHRDIEWAAAEPQRKKKILVLGDSFAAGYGIKNIEDRFSNVLGARLGDGYLVMNIGRPQLSTHSQIEWVQGFPYKPDLLILQYYVNDIEDAAKAKGVVFAVDTLQPGPLFAPLVENSYAANFVYWRVVNLGPRNWARTYLPWLKAVYDDPDIWWIHQQELLTIYNGAQSEQVTLLVVAFPDLNDVAGSRVLTDKVLKIFDELGVPTLNVADMASGLPPQQLVVNPFDPHPNEWLHHQVGERLYEMIRQIEQEDGQ